MWIKSVPFGRRSLCGLCWIAAGLIAGACQPPSGGPADPAGRPTVDDPSADRPSAPVPAGGTISDASGPVDSEGTTADSSIESGSTMVPMDDHPGLIPFSAVGGLWIDSSGKEVIVSASVSLTEGPIELFACPSRTKEYESLLVVGPIEGRLDPATIERMASLLNVDKSVFDSRIGARLGPAELIHTALVLIGLEPGHPVAFDPNYQPASGSRVRVRVRYRDADGDLKVVDAREWIRDTRTGEGMSAGWVFAGSALSRPSADGEERYEAEGGDLICVSNFQTAMLDLPVPSAQSNEALVFEVMPGRVPAKGTPVEILLASDETVVTNETGQKPQDSRGVSAAP
ncbi:MAG: YdjY domain-containing protein [Planctomycetaceae bacterium]